MQEFKDELVALYPELLSFAKRLTRNQTSAEDLVQETVIRALTRYSQFTPGTSVKSWVFKILHNHWKDQVGYSSRFADVSEKGDEAFEGEVNVHAETAQELSLQVQEIRQCMERLPVYYREALHLVAVAELSYEEAAQVLEISLSALKSRVRSARILIMQQLNPETRSNIVRGVDKAAMALEELPGTAVSRTKREQRADADCALVS